MDVSQCLLNKNVLLVAAKCVDADLSGCLLQFLQLGVKVWSFISGYCVVFVYVIAVSRLFVCLGECLVWKTFEDDSFV